MICRGKNHVKQEKEDSIHWHSNKVIILHKLTRQGVLPGGFVGDPVQN